MWFLFLFYSWSKPVVLSGCDSAAFGPRGPGLKGLCSSRGRVCWHQVPPSKDPDRPGNYQPTSLQGPRVPSYRERGLPVGNRRATEDASSSFLRCSWPEEDPVRPRVLPCGLLRGLYAWGFHPTSTEPHSSELSPSATTSPADSSSTFSTPGTGWVFRNAALMVPNALPVSTPYSAGTGPKTPSTGSITPWAVP